MALQARFQTFIIFTILKKVSKLFHPKNTSIRPSSLRPLEKNNYLLFQILNETFKEKFIIHNFNVLIILLIFILSCSLSSSNERSSLFNIHGFHRSKSERKESKRCLDSRPLFLQRGLQQSGRQIEERGCCGQTLSRLERGRELRGKIDAGQYLVADIWNSPRHCPSP